MKRLLLLLIITSLTFVACKKDDDESDQLSSLSGVLMTEDEEVITEAVVILSQNGEEVLATITDEEGSFDFVNIESGEYQISAYHADFKFSKLFDYTVSSGTDHEIDFIFIPNVSISGFVFGQDGQPLEEAEVKLYQTALKSDDVLLEIKLTDVTGKFEFYSLDPAAYKVVTVNEAGRKIEVIVDLNNPLTKELSLNFNNTGSFVDDRDGREYKTVEINGKVWLAENLAYLPQIDNRYDGSEDNFSGKYYYVYGFTPNAANTEDVQIENAKQTTNYKNYGVLYNWNAAMNGESSSSDNPSGVQGVCPDGWHLPSRGEWEELKDFVEDDAGQGAGVLLKQSGSYNYGTGLWYFDQSAEGLDAYGFAITPNGRRQYNNNFYNQRYESRIWTSTQNGTWNAYYAYSYYSDEYVGIYSWDKDNGFAVRCVKD